MSKAAAVDQALAEIPTLERSVLLEKFRKHWAVEAPPKLSRHLLELAVAYKIQEKAFGGLKPSLRKRILEGDFSKPTQAREGTVLVREWHGVHHTVTVHADGVIYRDQTFGSLSEVARLITGNRWSGPAFFGLKAGKKRGR